MYSVENVRTEQSLSYSMFHLKLTEIKLLRCNLMIALNVCWNTCPCSITKSFQIKLFHFAMSLYVDLVCQQANTEAIMKE